MVSYRAAHHEAPRKRLAVTPTGVSVSVFDNISQAVKIALDMPKQRWEHHITHACYGQYIYDPAQTMPRIRQVLLAVARGEAPREAVAVRRVEEGKTVWSRGDFMRHILSPERIEYKCARDFWRTYPDEPAALAVYLLTMQHTFPPYNIRSELSGGQEEWAAREKMLGFAIPQDMVFGDLTPDMLRPPLLRSLQMARQRGDALFILTLGPLLGELDAIMAQPSVPYVKN